MKKILFNSLFLSIISIAALSAQKYDKKIKEKFDVGAEPTLQISTNNTEIDVQVWNKNQIEVEAFIEVEGVDEKEAKDILKDLSFEILGNKSKVKITNGEANYFGFRFVDMDNFPKIEIPDIEIPELVFPEIEIPEFEFEFPEIEFEQFEMLDFEYDKYKDDSTYFKQYQKKMAKVMEKFNKSGWKVKMDSIRNSKEFKEKLKAFEEKAAKASEEVRKLYESQEFKTQLEEAKRQAEKAKLEAQETRVAWEKEAKIAKAEAQKAKEMIEKLKAEGKLDSITNSENIYFGIRGVNDKVKIKKVLKIKVPKDTKFDFNVRHGKVNVPESTKKMSATLSYSNFIGGVISGENNLSFSNTPTEISFLESGNINLKNVPNALFGTLNNANLFSNYSNVVINTVEKNTAISQKFGTINILNFDTNLQNATIILDYTNAEILSKTPFSYTLTHKNSKVEIPSSHTIESSTNKDTVATIKGSNSQHKSSNNIQITAVYSTVKML